MDIKLLFRRFLRIEKEKESAETLEKRIADQIKLYLTTKHDFATEREQEFKINTGLESTNQVEMRDAEQLLRSIERQQLPNKEELVREMRAFLQNLKDQEYFFRQAESLIRRDDFSGLEQLVHKEITMVREALALLDKADRRVA